MMLHKILIGAMLSALIYAAVAQKIVKKDTTKPIALVVADTLLKGQELPKEAVDAAKGLQDAQRTINSVYKSIKAEDVEYEKQEVVIKQMGQTIKSLTFELVGYRNANRHLTKENDELKKEIEDLRARNRINTNVGNIYLPDFSRKASLLDSIGFGPAVNYLNNK